MGAPLAFQSGRRPSASSQAPAASSSASGGSRPQRRGRGISCGSMAAPFTAVSRRCTHSTGRGVRPDSVRLHRGDRGQQHRAAQRRAAQRRQPRRAGPVQHQQLPAPAQQHRLVHRRYGRRQPAPQSAAKKCHIDHVRLTSRVVCRALRRLMPRWKFPLSFSRRMCYTVR